MKAFWMINAGVLWSDMLISDKKFAFLRTSFTGSNKNNSLRFITEASSGGNPVSAFFIYMLQMLS